MFEDVIQFEKNPDLSDNSKFVGLRAYWDGKRNGRAMPSRSDIDPIEMRPYLGNLFIAETLADIVDFRYRLIGSNLVPYYGQDMTGSTVTQVFGKLDPRFAEFVISWYRSVLNEGIVVRARGLLIWAERNYIRYDAIHLPLLNKEGAPGLILGMLVGEKSPAAALKNRARGS
jgi:hypothetical protein